MISDQQSKLNQLTSINEDMLTLNEDLLKVKLNLETEINTVKNQAQGIQAKIAGLAQPLVSHNVTVQVVQSQHIDELESDGLPLLHADISNTSLLSDKNKMNMSQLMKVDQAENLKLYQENE